MRRLNEAEKAQHRDYMRALRKADPETVRAKERDAAKRWRRENPEKYRAKSLRDSHRRRARLAEADVREVTIRDLVRMERRQAGRCFWCQAHHGQGLTIDHVVPIARGGRHSVGNIVLACATCNKGRRDRYVVEWRSLKGG